MADRYQQLVGSYPGKIVAGRLGLPRPEQLERQKPGRPTARGPVVLGPAAGGPASEALRAAFDRIGADLAAPAPGRLLGALVFDATGIADAAGLRALYDFFHPIVRDVAPSGRVIVVGRSPADCADPKQAGAQQGLEGFTRSLGKEIGRGRTVQLVRLRSGAASGVATGVDAGKDGGAAVESTLRFLLSARSAFVSGQVIEVEPVADVPTPADWGRPLAGQVALVTGAARGIGAAIAEVLARDGASVVCVDVPGAAEGLATVADRIGGLALTADVTDAPAVASLLTNVTGGLDVVVHNAGITRDRTLGRMKPAEWDAVLAVNLASQERFDDLLLDGGHLRPRGRIVDVSSISGLAGNAGQTNYATSKAAVAGRVRALAPVLRERGSTVNAVAPGFIETAMTAAVPLFVREVGRRLNSLNQGGLPVDVAETIAWLASPASAGVTGNVVRVCGQSLLGA